MKAIRGSDVPGSADLEVGLSHEADVDVGAPSNDALSGWYTRGYLPHFDSAYVIQMVTYRLADSLPADVVECLKSEYPDAARNPSFRKKIEEFIDAGHGACWLRRPDVAQVVLDSWLRFDQVRYLLHAWVIMPNHVHVLLQTIEPHSLSSVVQGWKAFTARRINEILGRQGAFWQREYWDRFIRDEEHYLSAIAYMHENPVKAGLVSQAEEWKWSSAGSADLPVGSSHEADVDVGAPGKGAPRNKR